MIQKKNVFTPDTTLINFFVPLVNIPENVLPIPGKFLDLVQKNLSLCLKTGMRYVFCTDYNVLSLQNIKILEKYAEKYSIIILNISKEDYYRPYYLCDVKNLETRSMLEKNINTLILIVILMFVDSQRENTLIASK